MNRDMFFLVLVSIILLVMLIASGQFNKAHAAEPTIYSVNELWKGLVAESIGNYKRSDIEQEMYAVACVVRNRLERGQWHGLCSLNRKDLDNFVSENVRYVYAISKKDFRAIAKGIINEVFIERGKDITGQATLFEDINTFGFPKSWTKEKVKKVCKIGTKTFFVEV